MKHSLGFLSNRKRIREKSPVDGDSIMVRYYWEIREENRKLLCVFPLTMTKQTDRNKTERRMKTAITVIATKLLYRQGEENRMKRKRMSTRWRRRCRHFCAFFFPFLVAVFLLETNSSAYYNSNLQAIIYFSMSVGGKKGKITTSFP